MPQTNYIAFTIGPIYETMSYCKKTRELWAGSYFFSYFMKVFISKIFGENDIEFLLPYVNKTVLDKSYEVGVFHDRFIAKSSKSKETLKQILEDRYKETVHEMAEFIDFKKKIDMTYKALSSYLQHSYIIATEDELISATGKENIIFAIDAILDSMELEYSFDFENSTKKFTISKNDYKNAPDGKVNPVAKLQYQAQRLKDEIKHTDLIFKTIPEIALASIVDTKKFKDFDFETFKNDDDIEKYEEFYKQFEEDDNFKPHHKYYAVISGDGDNMGKTIRELFNDNSSKITNLSKNIYSYITDDISLAKTFDEFGGMLIYAGGDDLLGFAPVFGKDGRSIFELLEELSKRFTNKVDKGVSLSFGVSINYYKYPMIEAINQAHSLLHDAKKHNTNDKKGSLALSLTKHSGQTFEGVFFIHDDVFKRYKKLFIDELNQIIKLPHNLQHSLKKYETIFIDIFANYHDKKEEKIEAVFKNLIKDESHSDEAKNALDELKEFILISSPSDKKSFEKLITQLAIIKFLRGDR